MTDKNSHSVLITESNPSLADLDLSWATAEFSAVDGIGPMQALHEAGDSVVAVAKMEDGLFKLTGSGVMVGPGLLLTATHVLDEFSRDGGGPVFLTFLPNAARAWLPYERSTATGQSEFEGRGRKVSDLSLVSCTLNSFEHKNHPIMLAPIRVALPLVGERIWAFGFRHQAIKDGAVSATPYVSSGLVTAVFPHGRGEWMPAPCIEANMETFGGMSGGAVVNSDGDLIGIVSSSLDGGPSYITLIWDALRLSIKGTIPKLTEYGDINLFKAKALGVVKIKGRVARRPWGDVVFTMKEEEASLLFSSVDPSSIQELAFSRDALDDFLEEHGPELESMALQSALDSLRSLSLPEMRKFLEVSGAPSECLESIERFNVEDLDGIEDFEVISTEIVDGSRFHIECYFDISAVIWTVEVSKSSYELDKGRFDQCFMSLHVEDGLVSMEKIQRCYFKMDIIFDKANEEFSDDRITWFGVRRPK